MKYRLRLSVLIVMTIFLVACGKSVEQQIEEQLQLGQKYLMEMKYDEAIAAFEKVISLEPKEFRGYEGLMTAYVETERKEEAEQVVSDGLAAADTITEWRENLRTAFLSFVDYAVAYFQGEGQDDVVIALLERRFQLEGNYDTYRLMIGLYRKTEQSEKLYQLLGEYSGENEEILKDKEDLAFAETFVQGLTDLCEAEDIDSLVAIMRGEDYAKLVDLIIRLDNPTFFVAGEMGLGIYPTDGMLYYGDFDGKMRDGNGLWVSKDARNYRYAKGMWENDKPNGYQEEYHIWANGSGMQIRRGNTVNGLWDGRISMTIIDDQGQDVFPITFDYGRWVILSYDEYDNNKYVVSVSDHQVRYCVLADQIEDLVGIAGFGAY